MTPYKKLQHLHALFVKHPEGLSRRRLDRELGTSKATTYRIIERLRDELGAPIVEAGRVGFFKYQEGEKFDLPGFWLSEGEIVALFGLAMWVSGTDESVIADIVNPLKERLNASIKKIGIDLAKFEPIAVLHMNSRALGSGILRAVCQGLLEQRRLLIRHGEKGKEIEREVSPQKLVRYRDNWYLDAYCHKREALRSFALFRVVEARVIAEKSKKIPLAELKEYYTTSYGIFSGKPTDEAVLKFSGYAATYVEGEKWHSEEKKEFGDGWLILKFPYRESKELVLDIMRWGPEVEVLEPLSLKMEVAKKLKAAADLYPSF